MNPVLWDAFCALKSTCCQTPTTAILSPEDYINIKRRTTARKRERRRKRGASFGGGCFGVGVVVGVLFWPLTALPRSDDGDIGACVISLSFRRDISRC